MGASKSKGVKYKEKPRTGIQVGGTPVQSIRAGGDPDSIMSLYPSWRFLRCDSSGRWAFNGERLERTFWSEIFPKLQELEGMTWSDILVKSQKRYHNIAPEALNKDAQDRLTELCVEAGAICSLRLTGKQRIYGYLEGPVYHILWYDNGHGDNDTCVCRSYKKHT